MHHCATRSTPFKGVDGWSTVTCYAAKELGRGYSLEFDRPDAVRLPGKVSVSEAHGEDLETGALKASS